MSISVEQYRYTIGLYGSKACGRRLVPSGMNYCTLNINVTLRRLLLTTHNWTDHNYLDWGHKQSVVIGSVALLGMMMILMIITLGMIIDISRSTKHLMSVDTQYSDDFRIPMPFSHILINWLVIILISSHSLSSYTKAFSVLYHIAKRKVPKRYNTSIWDIITKVYTLFIGLLNLLLIVIVTPSIVNPGPTGNTLPQCPSELKIAYCNIQGIIMMSSMKGNQPIFQTNKLLDFQNYLHMNKPDIVLVNESWLNEHIKNNEIVNENYYKMFRNDRTLEDKNKYGKVGGGGLFILVRQGINFETKLVSVKCDIPILSIEIKFRDSSKICLSTFYRYGYSSYDTFELAQTYYRELCRRYNKIVIIGDLNLSTVDDWEHPYSSSLLENAYIDLFNDLGLKCLINSPTHSDGNILDLLLTNQPGLIKNVCIEKDLACPSDHSTITFSLKKTVSRKKVTKKRVFKYKEADWEGLSEEIRSYNWKFLFQNKSISNFRGLESIQIEA